MAQRKRKRELSQFWQWSDPLNLYWVIGLYLFTLGSEISTQMASLVFTGTAFLYCFRLYDKKQGDNDAIKYVLTHIQHNHLESLKQKIRDYPEVLYEEYKQKDLCYWAKYYKNDKAHDLIIKLRNEYFEDE